MLQRELATWGLACTVIAPSLIPTKPGVQRKHDKYDAAQLARLFRAGERRIHIVSATPDLQSEVTWGTLGFHPPPRERLP